MVDGGGPGGGAAGAGPPQARLPLARRLAERLRSRIQPITGAMPAPRPAPPPSVRPVRRKPNGTRGEGVVVIGCSTGGPAALDAVLSALPADFPWPVLVAQHMPAAFTGALARRLDALTPLAVSEVTRLTPLERGNVYVGRGDADLVLSQHSGGLAANVAPKAEEFRWHPSVDRLTDSVMARVEPSQIVGVLMTGMGDDGAAAMTRLRAAGGRTIAEAEETAVVWGMPGELVRAGGADWVEPLEGIGARLAEMVLGS
jgi:two-component system chemotaxis response regulator CheB